MYKKRKDNFLAITLLNETTKLTGTIYEINSDKEVERVPTPTNMQPKVHEF